LRNIELGGGALLNVQDRMATLGGSGGGDAL